LLAIQKKKLMQMIFAPRYNSVHVMQASHKKYLIFSLSNFANE